MYNSFDEKYSLTHAAPGGNWDCKRPTRLLSPSVIQIDVVSYLLEQRLIHLHKESILSYLLHLPKLSVTAVTVALDVNTRTEEAHPLMWS